MELIAAILLAGPLGYYTRTPRRGLGLYLIAWTVIFPIQTAVVHADQPDDISSLYFLLNAAILGLGIGLNVAGSRFRARRSPDGVTMAG